MINLLPEEQKRQIKAARSNVLLIRYNLMLLGVLVFLGLALAISYYFLISAKTTAETTIKDNSAKESTYAQVKVEADQFRVKLGDANTVLNGQLRYSKAALAIGHLIPNGAALENLKLDASSFNTPTTFTFDVSGETAAANLIQNFNSSPLFSGVTKGKISKGSGSYPYTIDLTMIINREAAT